MGKLVKENDVLIYKLEENQPNDLYRIPKELGIGREKTIEGKKGVVLTSKDINKLADVLKKNNINGFTLEDMCKELYWHMLENLEEKEEELFFIAEYRE